jgi:hypothetical protein
MAEVGAHKTKTTPMPDCLYFLLAVAVLAALGMLYCKVFSRRSTTYEARSAAHDSVWERFSRQPKSWRYFLEHETPGLCPRHICAAARGHKKVPGNHKIRPGRARGREVAVEIGHISKFTPLTDNGLAQRHHLTEPEFHTLDTEYTLPLTKFVAKSPKFWVGPEFDRKAGELRAGARCAK